MVVFGSRHRDKTDFGRFSCVPPLYADWENGCCRSVSLSTGRSTATGTRSLQIRIKGKNAIVIVWPASHALSEKQAHAPQDATQVIRQFFQRKTSTRSDSLVANKWQGKRVREGNKNSDSHTGYGSVKQTPFRFQLKIQTCVHSKLLRRVATFRETQCYRQVLELTRSSL